MTKRTAIILRILALIANGYSLRTAVDAVLGHGTYERIAHELHAEMTT